MIVAPPPPRTMTREWQEATNARLKELGIEPISGPGSEDYKVTPTKIISDDTGSWCRLRRFCKQKESCCCP